MARQHAELTYAFDENSTGLLKVLRVARVDVAQQLTDLPSIGVPNGTLDPQLLASLGTKGSIVLILRDGQMLTPIIQRQAWKSSGVTLFLLSKQWGQLPLFELSRRFLFLWPGLLAHVIAGGQGVAWRVNPTIPSPSSSAFRLVTGLHSE